MHYLTVDEIKKHLIIDEDFNDDNDYLTHLGDVAEAVVEQQVNENLIDVTLRNKRLPKPLEHAMLLMIEYLYNNRGSEESDIPRAYKYMCALYRNYIN